MPGGASETPAPRWCGVSLRKGACTGYSAAATLELKPEVGPPLGPGLSRCTAHRTWQAWPPPPPCFLASVGHGSLQEGGRPHRACSPEPRMSHSRRARETERGGQTGRGQGCGWASGGDSWAHVVNGAPRSPNPQVQQGDRGTAAGPLPPTGRKRAGMGATPGRVPSLSEVGTKPACAQRTCHQLCGGPQAARRPGRRDTARPSPWTRLRKRTPPKPHDGARLAWPPFPRMREGVRGCRGGHTGRS